MSGNLELRLEKIENEIKKLREVMFSVSSKKRFFRSAGSWKGLDTERLKKKVYDSRKASSRRKVEF